ncbi:MAG: hypothetical protein ABIT20_22860 [Gemmatimonadaceae bacterium]
MDLYLVSLATGAIGLGAMAIGGLSHGGHAGHAGHAGHDAHGGHASHAQHGEHGANAGWSWSSLLAPRLLFSVMVGFGAGGIAATPLGEPFQLVAGLAAGAAFEALLVGPLWRFLFRFESRAAATLDSAIEDEARAVTGFDASGNGLVAVDVDGQIIQLLATLSADDRALGVRVRTGDLVRIAEIDSARGRCTVTAISR